jgi:phosphoglycerate dehydrogenase-like enzyme
MKVAILDDYQNVALRLADWSAVRRHAEITVFNGHVTDPLAVVARLRPFEVVCVMRERTPLTREILRQLPNLKLIASTGPRNASIDTQTAADLGIAVTATGYDSTPTIEFTWSLILASMRGIDREAASLKAGGWQTGLGSNLRGKSLGVVGLGNIGREVARIALAFGHEGDRLEPEPDRGEGQCCRRHFRRQAGTVPRSGCCHSASDPERPQQRPDRGTRVRLDEADGQIREHITGANR